jgi:hypothetical protein
MGPAQSFSPIKLSFGGFVKLYFVSALVFSFCTAGYCSSTVEKCTGLAKVKNTNYSPQGFAELDTFTVEMKSKDRTSDTAKMKFVLSHLGQEFDGTISNVRKADDGLPFDLKLSPGIPSEADDLLFLKGSLTVLGPSDSAQAFELNATLTRQDDPHSSETLQGLLRCQVTHKKSE